MKASGSEDLPVADTGLLVTDTGLLVADSGLLVTDTGLLVAVVKASGSEDCASATDATVSGHDVVPPMLPAETKGTTRRRTLFS